MRWYAVQHGSNYDWDNRSEYLSYAVKIAIATAKKYEGEEIRIVTIVDDVAESEEIVREGTR